MSNQGNIAVESQGKTLYFTTDRWGGREPPQVAFRCLKNAADSRDFLYTLIRDESVERPIFELGNTDTPTVYVNFDSKTVRWKWEYNNKIIGVWTFEEYLKLPGVHMLPEYQEWYDQ